MNAPLKPQAAKVYTYDTMQNASVAKTLLLSHGIDAYLLPGLKGQGARVVAIVPEVR